MSTKSVTMQKIEFNAPAHSRNTKAKYIMDGITLTTTTDENYIGFLVLAKNSIYRSIYACISSSIKCNYQPDIGYCKRIPFDNSLVEELLHTVHNHQVKLHFKATFSFPKLIPKNTQMTTLYTNWSLYDLLYLTESFCKVFSSLSYIRRISGLFITNAIWTH